MSSTVQKLPARSLDVGTGAPEHALSEAQATPELDFREVYESRFHEVMRWIRALGGRDEDLDDLAQEVFIIVRRKLSSFDGHNLNGWIYRITQRTVRDYRRAAWFRNLLARKKVSDHEGALLKLVEPGRGPAEEQELREAQRALREILGRMREKHRTAFVLFEIEGYTGEEIAHGVWRPKPYSFRVNPDLASGTTPAVWLGASLGLAFRSR